jgi:hypothetical protein
MSAPTTPASTARTGRSRTWGFVGIGLVVALLLAGVVSFYASSSPDGLEKVAADRGLDANAEPHSLGNGPLADYGVRGVDNERLSVGLAGIVGVGVTFAVAGGLFLLVRRRGISTDPSSGADSVTDS